MKITKPFKTFIAGILATNSVNAKELENPFENIEITKLKDPRNPESCATMSLYPKKVSNNTL